MEIFYVFITSKRCSGVTLQDSLAICYLQKTKQQMLLRSTCCLPIFSQSTISKSFKILQVVRLITFILKQTTRRSSVVTPLRSRVTHLPVELLPSLDSTKESSKSQCHPSSLPIFLLCPADNPSRHLINRCRPYLSERWTATIHIQATPFRTRKCSASRTTTPNILFPETLPMAKAIPSHHWTCSWVLSPNAADFLPLEYKPQQFEKTSPA